MGRKITFNRVESVVTRIRREVDDEHRQKENKRPECKRYGLLNNKNLGSVIKLIEGDMSPSNTEKFER